MSDVRAFVFLRYREYHKHMNTSKYTDSILNAIASGFQTINDICAAINANYASVQRVTNNLVSEKRIIRNEIAIASRRGEKYGFALSMIEKWRLYSHSCTFLIIDIGNNFDIDTEMSVPIFSADIFDMYNVAFDILNRKAVYVQTKRNWNRLFEIIEKKIEFRSLLPLLIVTSEMEITSELLKLLVAFSHYSLPILYIKEDAMEWIFEPPQCSIEKINDPTIELIYNVIKNHQTNVDALYVQIEELRKKIENPQNDDNVMYLKRELKELIEKYNDRSISVKMLSDTLNISPNTISKYLQILLSSNRIKKNQSAFNIRWYIDKKRE